jgi:hypothetical protein
MNIRTAARRCVSWADQGWKIIGLTLLAFLLAEGAWRVARHAKRVWTGAAAGSPGTDVFDLQPWGAQVKRDTEGYGWPSTFEPFVDFRPRPWQSPSVNVREDGMRVTPHGAGAPDAGPSRVFCFGGSTMLGVGVPDWGTIPAYLALEYEKRGLPCEVVNCGAGWWTSSQSLARLTGLLRAGTRPDVVVFYDGINEVNVVSFGGRVAGISPEAEVLLARGLENESRLLQDIVSSSALVKGILSRIRPDSRSKRSGSEFAIPAAEIDRYAGEIVHAYEENVRMVGALAREYGFSTYFFLQPYPLIAKKPLTRTETVVTAPRRRFRPGEEKLFARVYEMMRASEYLRSRGDFHDLQDVFAGEKASIYIDSEHLLPPGNELIARAMSDAISRRRPPPRK